MGCDQCQNSLCQKAVHTSKIGYMCSDLLETGGMYQLQKWGGCVVEMGGMYQLYKWGVCVVEMGGMYQLQKWGVCVVEMALVSDAETGCNRR